MVKVMTSGVKMTDVRISNFRSLKNVAVALDNLTVLVGANNVGKTSFIEAMYAAIGAGRKALSQDDIGLEPDEALPPKDRKIVIDMRVMPVGDGGKIVDSFPAGSYWTSLWGNGISQDPEDFHDFMAFRTTFSWNLARGDYVLSRKFLKEWKLIDDWLSAEEKEPVSSAHIEPIALHYIDAKRDIDEDLRKQGSFWRRLTDDLGLSEEDIKTFEDALSLLNEQIVGKSDILKHLKKNLSDVTSVVAGESAGVDIAPVARRLRDLSKGMDVTFSTAGAQGFPMTRHGMGTRSLASLLVFRAYASWRSEQATKAGIHLHTLLALEEPEAHLHPQAQRSLFAHIKTIPGQRIVSTHSPYIAGQAGLGDLRLFFKDGDATTVRRLNLSPLNRSDVRKLRRNVVASRGDILFARALVLFEGETEEQALPVWAETFWGKSIHELGFNFVGVGGNDYFPFIWLANNLGIRWYILSDGERKPVKELTDALVRAGFKSVSDCQNVVVLPDGNDLEKQLLVDGYLPEIEKAFDETNDRKSFLDNYIASLHGQPGKKGVPRNYKVPDGRILAALDAMREKKTDMAVPIATTIANAKNPERRVPPKVAEIFEIVSKDFGFAARKGVAS